MANKHCDVWEEIVKTDEEKRAVLAKAKAAGLQWVSSSRVERPDGKGFIPHIYRMRFVESIKKERRKLIPFVGKARGCFK